MNTNPVAPRLTWHMHEDGASARLPGGAGVASIRRSFLPESAWNVTVKLPPMANTAMPSGTTLSEAMTAATERIAAWFAAATATDDDITVTQYTVCALPLDHPDAYGYAVTVQRRGQNQWSICHQGLVLNTTDMWGMDRINDSTPEAWEQWLNTHTFNLDTALEKAQRITNLWVSNIAGS